MLDDPKLFDLRVDLAELYIKLKGFDDAKRVLIEALKFLNEIEENPTRFIKQNKKSKFSRFIIESIFR